MRSVGLLLVAILAACSAHPGGSPTPSAVPTEGPRPSSTEAARPAPTEAARPSPTEVPTSAPTLPPETVAGVGEIRSPVGRAPIGSASDQELAALVAADTEFAIRLYRKIAGSEQGNVFISPYSISTALSMAYAGARGETAQQMDEVMGIGPDAEAWHAARNRLELELAALAAREWRGKGKGVPLTLEALNTAFGQANYPFKVDFLDTLAAFYGAGLQAVDFIGATEEARQLINAWVAEKTRDRIPRLIGEGVLTPLTRLVLVNAIYFKANWLFDFDRELTTTKSFHLLDGSTRDVEMMHRTDELPYARGDGWQAVHLAYVGAEMTIVVPDDGRFADIDSALDAAFLRSLAGSWAKYEVELGVPRWESESQLELVETLEQMGIVDLFDEDGADLSGIADVEQLFVSDVVHVANITVDEDGTEAAAATAAVATAVCACGPEGKVTLTIDRPFLYFIQDDVTGEILFMGRLLEP